METVRREGLIKAAEAKAERKTVSRHEPFQVASHAQAHLGGQEERRTDGYAMYRLKRKQFESLQSRALNLS